MAGTVGLRAIAAGALALALGACSAGGFAIGDRVLTFPWDAPQENVPMAQAVLPAAPGETFGQGPVRVALLLPLSDPALGGMATALANGARLAMSFIEANPNIAENITISLSDSGASVGSASQAATAALQDGASLILGPVRSDQVMAVGFVARSAGVPVIGFANTSSAAAPGVYLLSVLPETATKRSLAYALGKGSRGFAGAFPATEAGAAQERAFRQAVAAIGLSPAAVYTYGSAAEVQGIVQQAMPMLKTGYIDTLFVPDPMVAPAFGAALQQTGAAGLLVVGSADWDSDGRLAQAPGLTGAIYPAIDPRGLLAISAEYQTRFGSPPPQLTTLAYTAVILANVKTLSLSNPRYEAAALTAVSGFNGRDGVFRFLANGQGEYALAIKQVGNGGAAVVEGAKL
ncbi:MAG: transporter substrate-binding protein [Devosia sp.]|uniref:penicillin-binding protein activator n=1 Tax=Devosia sp. TaxID=1871048 RepID=UPI0026313050|nr:penicillin-binding protein activator [Devosia sp.]MDB5530769.1 transporter substrate-binding protein [Devosia sp.]